MNTRIFRTILAVVLIFALLLPSFNGASAQVGKKDKLDKNDRQLLAEARANGKATVTVLIASFPGANNQVAAGIASLGGVIGYREDDISYLRAELPIDAVEAAAQLSGVQALDLDELIPLPDPRPEPEGVVGVIPQPAPNAGTPKANPYMPIQDIGAAQFMAANPTWDGRGVTIGIVDTGSSLDHPSLLTTSTGERKIIDWVTATDPFGDDDPTWLDMQNQVSGSTFTFNGVTYTAPANGSYRIALFNERDSRLGGEVGNDVNRDGNPAGSNGSGTGSSASASSRIRRADSAEAG